MSAREPLSAARLAEYAALEAAATPGPWSADGHEIYQGTPDDYTRHSLWIGETCNIDLPDRGDANGAFIAHARQMVPALLAEVARLTSAPVQIASAAERVVRQQLGRGATAAEIVQALADAALLTRTVRPAHEPAGGAL